MRLWLFGFFLLACQLPLAELQGRVVKVIDGDTIEILDGKTKTRVRLYAVDAPERGQDFYVKSKEYLASLVAGKTVRVVENRVDRWKRVVGDVYLSDGRHVNTQLVAEGWAWHFIRYSDSPELARLEKQARQQRKGLWRHDRPVPPWEFRKQKRSEKE
jgi:endonuclease YncB( thermonuclease family)